MNDKKAFLDRISQLPPKRLALLTAQLQAKLDSLEEQKREPIAIIGLSCRFPGASSPEAYWQMLRDGVDAVTEVPPLRWPVDDYYDPDPDAPGKMSTRWGGFIDDVDRFDAQFFGISPREAASMDPQQRLLLEVSWEALERAGQSPDKLSGSRTGIFVGIAGADYAELQTEVGHEAADAYLASGVAHSIASGRLSYVLGVHGPSLSVDTACSSSLVAIHLALQSLRQGECRLALAGGVNTILSPTTTITLSKARMMAPDGRCKTFDARADGFVRGEGCGMVVLKRLSDAIADNDPILALIRGSAVNQDGRSNGLTAPNGPAQEAVMRDALADAGLEPDQISYVETHGTGTSLGDPIEVQALGAVLSQGRSPDNPVMLGSVKTNVGHLEAAAGVAGLIKLVLALQHGQIPPHLHLQEANPFIPWDELPVTVPTELTDWRPENGRFAGVSSFGFSGTNAHVILAANSEQLTVNSEQLTVNNSSRPLHLFTLSAKDQPALGQLVERYQRHLADHNPSFSLPDLCFTANAGRAQFNYRLALSAATTAEVQQKLAAFATGAAAAGTYHNQVQGTRQPRLAFLFTGQGAQYPDMGRQLYETQPVFRAALDRCEELLRPYLDQPLLSVMFSEQLAVDSGQLTVDSEQLTVNSGQLSIDDTAYTQPALFALEWALAQLWQSWGIRPAVVMGHSVGEYVAACVAGVFSLEDGLKLIAVRGRLMQALPQDGAMAAVFATEAQVETAVAPYSDQVSIAAVNGPENIVISGAATAVDTILQNLAEQEIKARRLTVSHAFHSPLMEPVLDTFEEVAATISYHPPQIALISNLSGRLAQMTEDEGRKTEDSSSFLITTPGYWREHVRQAVQFAAGMQSLQEQGCELFLEIGPSPTLLGMGRRCLPDNDGLWLPSLRQGRDEWQTILAALAQLYVQGLTVDWDGFDQPYPRRRLILPTYPFQRERYWLTTKAEGKRKKAEGDSSFFPLPSFSHPLLGWQLATAGIRQTIFETRLGQERLPYLDDHRIYDRLVLPSPAYVEMALAAAAAVHGRAILEDMVIHEAMLLPDEGEQLVQLVLTPAGNGRLSGNGTRMNTDEHGFVFTFQIFSGDGNGDWRLHASGRLSSAEEAQPAAADLAAIQARCDREIGVATYYDSLARLGLQFGPCFQGIERMWRGEAEALARMSLPDALLSETADYQIHPALLDACFHALGTALPDAGEQVDDAFLLLGLDRLQIYAPVPPQLWNHVHLQSGQNGLEGQETFSGDIHLYDDAGQLVARLQGLHLKRARPETLLRVRPEQIGRLLYELVWQPLGSNDTAVPTPTQIAAQVQPIVGDLSRQHGMEGYEELLPQLETLCAAYVSHACHQLGWQWTPGQTITVDTFMQQLAIQPQHRSLVNRLLAILGEESVLRNPVFDKNRVSSWQVAQPPAAADPQAQWQVLVERYPAFSAELNLTGRCGQALAAVLRGETDPLHVLFPGGSLVETEKMYQDSPAARTYNSLVAETVTAALAGRLMTEDGGRRTEKKVRILEIGAGTGGTTSYVLPVLPTNQVEYTFTDISPLFLNKAKQKFSDYASVQYRTLDIAADPAGQGFEAQQYDLILAANVLHATADLRQTLGHVQQLLAPGGLLILVEGTTPSRFGDLTVGLTDGWWAFNDHDLRPSYALISRRQWLDLLAELGFSQAVTIPDENAQGALARQTVILAQMTADEGPKTEEAPPSSNWLIFADAGGVGQALAEQLPASILVTPGESFAATDTNRYRLNPAVPDQFHQLMSQVTAESPPLRGVIHLWSLDAALDEETNADQLAQATGRACASALHLTQALLSHVGDPVPLWLVTRGAQAVGPDETHPTAAAQATVWGLGHVIALEHPELGCVRLDLDPTAAPEQNATALLTELAHHDGREDRLALRHNRRYAARLLPKAKGRIMNYEKHSPFIIHNSSFLITGGLAGLGLLVAEWLVEQGARHLVLMSRSGANETAQVVLRRLEQQGAEIKVVQGDVSQPESLARALTEIEATMPPLRGVIHSAGVLDDGALLQQNWSRFTTVMAPKVAGSWHLHTLTRHLPLDFFVLFSSGASLLGSPGQSNHAAANAFIDALAHYRRAQGLPAVSINWGAWAEVGAAARHKLDTQQNVEMIAPHEGLLALGHALRQERLAQMAVLPVTWDRFLGHFAPGSEPPLYRELARTIQQKGERPLPPTETAVQEAGLRQKLAAALPNKRLPLLRDHVRAQAAAVLALDAARVDLHQPLQDLGLDSLMAVELRNLLGSSVEQTLPATLLFDHPTVMGLTHYLAGEVLQLEQEARPEVVVETAEPTPVEDALDDLSDDEMALLLAQKLEKLGR